MPRKDPETGKRLSGAAQRAADDEAERQRMVSAVDDGSAYAAAGMPDLDAPDLGLAYVRKVQLIAFRQICNSALPVAEKWKLIKEHAAVIGISHNRSAVESRADRMEKRGREGSRRGAARVEPGSSVQRPPTARGARKAPRARQDARPAGPAPETTPPAPASSGGQP